MAFPGAGAPGDQQMETVAPPRPWHNGSPDKAKAKKLAQKESTKESAKGARSPPWSWPPARRTRRSERTGEGLAQQRIGMCGAGTCVIETSWLAVGADVCFVSFLLVLVSECGDQQ